MPRDFNMSPKDKYGSNFSLNMESCGDEQLQLNSSLNKISPKAKHEPLSLVLEEEKKDHEWSHKHNLSQLKKLFSESNRKGDKLIEKLRYSSIKSPKDSES